MSDRRNISNELWAIERELKELEIRYEQYFSGVEKREPMAARDSLSKRLKHFVNRKIVQTDLRFKYQSLAKRFHSYAAHWDRILRLIDEGRYHRQAPSAAEPVDRRASGLLKEEKVERVYREFLRACNECNDKSSVPSRRQLADFLEQQQAKIREKFGDREVEFHVFSKDGKPRIKIRAKK